MNINGKKFILTPVGFCWPASIDACLKQQGYDAVSYHVTARQLVLEQFPKTVERLSDKKYIKNKYIERLTEPGDVKTAPEPFTRACHLDTGPHLLYLPCLLGLWALHHQMWITTRFCGLICDKPLPPPCLEQLWIKARLKAERARLGGDVRSLWLHRRTIAPDAARLTIRDWLALLARPMPTLSFPQDYIFHLNSKYDMRDWMIRHCQNERNNWT